MVDIGSLPNFDYCSKEQLIAIIRSHNAFEQKPYVGQSGFSFPLTDNINVINVQSHNIQILKDCGVTVSGEFGANNFIFTDFSKSKTNNNLEVHFHGCGQNIIVLSRIASCCGIIDFEGNGNIFVAGVSHSSNRISAVFRYHSAGLFLGKSGSSPGSNYWIEGPGKSIQIGDDFMFSWSVSIRTADSHGIVDLEAGEIVNFSQNIVIGQHVWLGEGVIVMPGTRIGGGCVIGARSIVTRSLPSACVAAGVPARIIRCRTSWTRSAVPTAEEIEDLQSKYWGE